MNTPSIALSCRNPLCKSRGSAGYQQAPSPSFAPPDQGRSPEALALQALRQHPYARNGTPYHRLRNPASRFDVVLKMVMEGSSKTSISRVQEISVSTVQRWIERAAKQASSFTDGPMARVPWIVDPKVREGWRKACGSNSE